MRRHSDAGWLNGPPGDTSVITLTTAVGLKAGWRDSDYSAVRPTLAHELGHLVGVHHPVPGSNCSSAADAVMLEATTSCGGSNAAFSPTINDTLPVLKTVYGGGPQTKCGFPIP